MNLNKYGFVSINELKISKEEKEIIKRDPEEIANFAYPKYLKGANKKKKK